MNYIVPAKLVDKRLNGRNPPGWKLAVISFRDRKGSDGLARAFDAYPLSHTVFYGQEAFAESPFVFEANLGEETVGLLTRCIWGGPQAAILVEELAYLSVKYLIGYGSAGALDPALHLGQQVVVSSALANDGTSRAYTQTDRIEADADLIRMALRSGEKIGRGVTPVTAVTVESFYRESEELASVWRHQGAQIVNFEASAFYAVSKACGIKSVWLSPVSDRLGDKWEDWFWDRDEATRNREHLRRIGKTAESIPKLSLTDALENESCRDLDSSKTLMKFPKSCITSTPLPSSIVHENASARQRAPSGWA